MITADPTYVWIFVIVFGVTALRMLQRPHRGSSEQSTQRIRSRDERS